MYKSKKDNIKFLLIQVVLLFIVKTFQKKTCHGVQVDLVYLSYSALLQERCLLCQNCGTPVFFVFYRYNSERTEAFQESSSETTVLFFYQEVQGGTEEAARPADGLRHYKT